MAANQSRVYIVTSLARQRDSAGAIVRVWSRCHGVFTSKTRAEGVANEYGGVVTLAALDRILIGIEMQSENVQYSK